jgi:mono/diheme cytochrome c family protein
MNPIRKAVPVRARPLAPLAAILVLAVSAHAVLVGCGGKSQDATQSTSETPTTTPPDTSAGGGDGVTAGAASVELGQRVYTQRCVLCHGAQGKGDGPGAAALNPKPRDHTDGTYMKTQTDEQLLSSIRDGKGQMPAWGKSVGTAPPILNETEIQSVLMYVRTLAR